MHSPSLAELPPPPPGKTGWPWTEASPPLPITLPGGSPWPRLSVVTPSYNQGLYLEEALRSVLLQGYPDLEYAVMDGGSTDDSAAIIRRYAPWLARWASERDRGQSHAVNKGLLPANGDIAGWLNSDDIFRPGALRAAAEAFAAAPEAVVIYGKGHLVDAEGNFLAECYAAPFDRALVINRDNPIPQPAAFIRLRDFQAVGGLDETLQYMMDYDLWLRLDERGPLKHVPDVLAHMRVHPHMKTLAGDHGRYPELRRLVEERYGRHSLPTGFADWLVSTHLPKAFEAYRRDDGSAGRDELAFVMENVPAWRTDSRRLAREIANQAWLISPGLTGDDGAVLDFAEQVCRHLPAAVAAPAAVRRQTLALLYETLALRNYKRGEAPAARRQAWQAVGHDPARAGNKGTWSILACSLVAGRNGAGAVEDGELEHSRRRALDWLRSVRADDEHFAPEAASLAVLALAAANGLVEVAPTPEDKARWGRALLRHQDVATGLFRDAAQSPGDQRPTFLALAALAALGVTERQPLAILEPYRSPVAVRAWLAGLDWSQPSWFLSLDWSHPRLAAGAQAMYLTSLLIHEAEHSGDAAYRASAHALLDWLDEHQDPDTGFWLLGRGSPDVSPNAAQGHFAFLYFYLGRPVRYPKQMIDTTLGLQQMDGLFDSHGESACADQTAIDLLVKCSLLTSHRAADVRQALGYARRAILQRQNADGSFGSAAGVGSQPSNGETSATADVWSTWLRLSALALSEAGFSGGASAWRFGEAPVPGWHAARQVASAGGRA